MGGVRIRRAKGLIEAWSAMHVLGPLEEYYPGFAEWLVNKAVPSLERGDGGMAVAEKDGRVVGCSLWKDAGREAKLRCVRVAKEAAGRGIGMKLIDEALDAVGTRFPLATVPQELFGVYGRLLVNHYGFHLTRVEKGLYRPGKLEYVFNGSPGVPPPGPY